MNTVQYLLERSLGKAGLVPLLASAGLSGSFLPTLTPSLPASSDGGCCFSFKWTVGFFYFIQVLDSPYRPHSFGGCQLVLSTDVSFLRLPFFSPFKEKEPLRQQASLERKIKNLDITYLAALLPTGLCKTQLNVSPLNTALQYIKQKILQAWWLEASPQSCSLQLALTLPSLWHKLIKLSPALKNSITDFETRGVVKLV